MDQGRLGIGTRGSEAGEERLQQKRLIRDFLWDDLYGLLNFPKPLAALFNGWILNIAIGLQVLLGALVTGLSSTIKPSKVSL